jgi:hypothetical protein
MAASQHSQSSDDLDGLTLRISREAMETTAQRSLAAHRRTFQLTDLERERLRAPRAARRRRKAA